MIKNQFFTILFLLLSSITFAQPPQSTLPTFLEGVWKVDNKSTYERWDILEDGSLVGASYKMVDGEPKISEDLTIRWKEKNIVYTATVFDQNEGKGVSFTLNQPDEKTYSFENPEHDFPQKIIYKRIHPDILYVKVLGKEDQGFSFHMYRQSEQTAGSGLGMFSMSLAVKDIQASYDFYQKLGFEHLVGAGSVEQQWMILKQGTIKIGLFQGMFPDNTLTFNPKDARAIYQQVKAAGFEVEMAMGMDKSEGPCSFTLIDPDGNPILFDQY